MGLWGIESSDFSFSTRILGSYEHVERLFREKCVRCELLNAGKVTSSSGDVYLRVGYLYLQVPNFEVRMKSWGIHILTHLIPLDCVSTFKC
jgi:hypothetical protein